MTIIDRGLLVLILAGLIIIMHGTAPTGDGWFDVFRVAWLEMVLFAILLAIAAEFRR